MEPAKRVRDFLVTDDPLTFGAENHAEVRKKAKGKHTIGPINPPGTRRKKKKGGQQPRDESARANQASSAFIVATTNQIRFRVVKSRPPRRFIGSLGGGFTNALAARGDQLRTGLYHATEAEAIYTILGFRAARLPILYRSAIKTLSSSIPTGINSICSPRRDPLSSATKKRKKITPARF